MIRTFRSTALTVLASVATVAVLVVPVAADEGRQAKILGNLRLSMPQLAELEPTMGEITASGISGLDQGTFTVRGRPYTFLVTTDDTKLWLVQGEALDVSRSQGEIDRELAKRAEDEKKAAQERKAKLAALVEGRPFRGNADAPVTIIEFSDFQCPYCARGANTMEEVVEKYPDDVKFYFMHFPLGFHPWAKPASIAANCAGNQKADAFWVLHDAYFVHQKALTPENIVSKSKGYLDGADIDIAVWEKCASDTSSAEYKAEAQGVDEEMALGQSLGVTGTPGFFVNGEFLNGAQPLPAFVTIIEKVKAGS